MCLHYWVGEGTKWREGERENVTSNSDVHVRIIHDCGAGVCVWGGGADTPIGYALRYRSEAQPAAS